MITKKPELLLLLGILLFGCKEPVDNHRVSIKKNDIGTISLREIGTVKITRIETTPAVLLGDMIDIKISAGTLYIADTRKIHQFAPDGKHLRSIEHVGRGPGEYTGISDFLVIDDEIIITNAAQQRILFYSKDDTLIRQHDAAHRVEALARLNDSILVVTSSYSVQDDKFHLYNLGAMEEVASFFPITPAETRYRFFMGQRNFSSYRGKLLFNETMNNTIREITAEGVQTRYHFDLFGKTPPETFYQTNFQDVRAFIETSKNNGHVNGISRFAESARTLLFTFLPPEGGERLCWYDKENGKSKQFASILVDDDIPPVDIDAITICPQPDGELALLIPAHFFVDEHDIPFTNKFGPIAANDNPVLCTLTLP
jgi:hypothetical protein